ncbi:MAG: alginate lyase family protein [Anaerolineales bacterium]
MTSARTALRAVRALGARSSAHYLHYQAVLKSGWIRSRTPVRAWESFEIPINDREPTKIAGRFFWQADLNLPAHLNWAGDAREQARIEGDRILEGVFPLFGLRWVELGSPPDWHAFAPLAEAGKAGRVPPDSHWTDYSLDDLGADVKLLWEPSRMSWAFKLGRAYRWTGDEAYAEGFWKLLQSWCQSHKPNRGPHWISAQEVAFRILALSFSRVSFGSWLNQQQHHWLATVVRAHASRIPPTIAYSRAQRNNHLLTEAVGLLTAGLLFPQLPESKRWSHTGYRWLAAGLADQVFEDGGYIQHSTNYGRLALELGCWAAVICERNDLALQRRSKDALVRLAGWLTDMVDPAEGRAPNFGPNDGTQLLPLTESGFSDYRPTLQVARAVLGGKALYGDGPWDELCYWFGTEPPPRRTRPKAARVDHSKIGVYSTGGDSAHAFLRAADFHSRPGHVDQMHVDLWWRGRNLALDPGTYLYNGEPPWDNALAGALFHNTIVVDGRQPMEKAGRFLWLDWSKASLVNKSSSPDGQLELMIAEHDGYQSLGVRHRRSLLRAGDNLWLVVDDLEGSGHHAVVLPWLLPMADWSTAGEDLRLNLPEGGVRLRVAAAGLERSLYSAGERLLGPGLGLEAPQLGWNSPTYALKEPALHWISRWRGTLPVQILSWWCFDGAEPAALELRWGEGHASLLRAVHMGGATLRI